VTHRQGRCRANPTFVGTPAAAEPADDPSGSPERNVSAGRLPGKRTELTDVDTPFGAIKRAAAAYFIDVIVAEAFGQKAALAGDAGHYAAHEAARALSCALPAERVQFRFRQQRVQVSAVMSKLS
jgi:hypothetical protein